nr:MAG TPA: hypothetical protein [Microviridae sp.]
MFIAKGFSFYLLQRYVFIFKSPYNLVKHLLIVR